MFSTICGKDTTAGHCRTLTPCEVCCAFLEFLFTSLKLDPELIHLVHHLQTYPNDSLGATLRNIFDFDIYKPETIDQLATILERHGFARLLLWNCLSLIRFADSTFPILVLMPLVWLPRSYKRLNLIPQKPS